MERPDAAAPSGSLARQFLCRRRSGRVSVCLCPWALWGGRDRTDLTGHGHEEPGPAKRRQGDCRALRPVHQVRPVDPACRFRRFRTRNPVDRGAERRRGPCGCHGWPFRAEPDVRPARRVRFSSPYPHGHGRASEDRPGRSLYPRPLPRRVRTSSPPMSRREPMAPRTLQAIRATGKRRKSRSIPAPLLRRSDTCWIRATWFR